MKNTLLRSFISGSLLLTLLLSSCAPYDPYSPYGGGWGGYGRPTRADGAVGGALLGAAAGGIIGNQSRRGLEGAAIGGLLGALAGSAIQNSREQRFYNQPYTGYDGYHPARFGRVQNCAPPPPCGNPYGFNSGFNPGYSPYGW
jgi:hypothetical protein